MDNIKNFEFGCMLKRLKEKDVFLITTVIYLAIILLYELFYCNFEYFTGIIQNYNFSAYRIIVYCVIYFLFYKLKDKFIKSAVEALNSKVKCYFIDMIIFFTILLSIPLIIIANKNLSVNITIAFISILIFNLFAIYISNNIIKNAIITALLFGSVFSISVTFNNQLDEKRHFLSSYSISLGKFNLNSAEVDKDVLDMPRMMKAKQFIGYFSERPTDEIINDFSDYKAEDTPSTYMVLSYLVSAVGIFISKLLGGSIADIYITGRIFNLLAYILLIAITLKILPHKKYIIYSIFFMPMLLALASVYSPDGIGTALIALFIAYCLRLHEKDSIKIKEVLKLLLLLILAASIKSVGYIGIVLIVFILPLKKILRQNKKYIKYLIPALAIIGVAVIFIYITNINAPGDTRVQGTGTREQFEYILKNPIQYFKVLLKHIVNVFFSLRGMSFLNAPMFFSKTYYNVFLVMTIYLFFISITDSSKQLKIKHRILFVFTFFVICAMISTAMYLSYTKVGATYIDGYQMRYMFPTLALIFMSISVKKFGLDLEKKFNYSNLYIAYPMVIFLIISLLDLTII